MLGNPPGHFFWKENEMKKKSYKEMNFVWVSSHWDIHLKGLCIEEGKLQRFKTDYDTELCTIYPLTTKEKFIWLFKKKMFEWCVGYHWTYPHRKTGNLYHRRKPVWIHKGLVWLYYTITLKEIQRWIP
jgi:hypothetical protein